MAKKPATKKAAPKKHHPAAKDDPAAPMMAAPGAAAPAGNEREVAAIAFLNDLGGLVARHNIAEAASPFEIKAMGTLITADRLTCPPGCKRCIRRCQEEIGDNGESHIRCWMECLD